MMRRTPRPYLSSYAWNSIFADVTQFAPDYYREGREVALTAMVTHDTLEAVGLTGGFVSEALS